MTPTIVSGHYERREIIRHKMLKFGKRYNEPILTWVCPIRVAQVRRRNLYQEPEAEVANVYKELTQYFVRGAECVLTDKIHGLRKQCI